MISMRKSALFALLSASLASAQDNDFDGISSDASGDDGGLQHHNYTRYLKFREDGTFKFLNFSDLLVDDSSEDWLQTQGLIERILNQEEPDLIILTGDIVKRLDSYEYGYDSLFGSAMQVIKARKIPYVWTGGNSVNGLTPYELHEIDYTFGGQYSWTGYVWDLGHDDMKYSQEELGYFTSRIPILDFDETGEVLSVFTLDSSDRSCMHPDLPGFSCVSPKTVEWLGLQQQVYSHEYDYRDFIFMHRPIQEFMHFANLYHIVGHKQQVVGCQSLNTGVYAQSIESKQTAWINAGGDANNDFAGKYHDLYFSYSRKSGYGGDGDLPRGVRVFSLTYKKGKGLKGHSYTVDGETGEKNVDMEKQYPPSLSFLLQTQCNTDVFAEMFSH